VAGRARPHWGWHRLDSEWARQIVSDARVGRGDLVLDIGAGTGAITRELVDVGARVVAVELHRLRAGLLREEFVRRDVVVVQADAADLRLPKRPFRVVANPPFEVLAPLLRRLVSHRSRLMEADIVVPRWFAGRWVGGGVPGVGRWSAEFRVTTGRPLPRRAFHPPPPRDAVVLVVTRVQPVQGAAGRSR